MHPEPLAFIGTSDLAGLLRGKSIPLSELDAAPDAYDLGYLVTVATDACATLTQERHDWSLRLNRGYCRQVTTATLVDEIERLTGASPR